MSDPVLSSSSIPQTRHPVPWHLRGYSLALVAVGAGWLLRLGVVSQVGPGLPTFITFYPAVMLAALVGGFWPGAVATAASAAVVDYWIFEPVGHFNLNNPADTVALVLFAAMGVLMSGVAEMLRRARQKAATYKMEIALREAREQLRQSEEQRKAADALKEANERLEQRVAERTAALRESEERLRFALETSHTGAWDLDLANHTAYRSLEHDRIFGYQELLPQWTYEMFLEHVVPGDRAEVDAKFRSAMANHGDWNFECRIRRADSEVRWIWAAGRQRVDHSDSAPRMAGIVQDITERKQAEVNQQLLTDVLRVFNQGGELRSLINEALRLIRLASGFDAVALRLRQADDCPYYQQSGFPDEFLREENSLCARGQDGAIQRDASGRAMLECTCGLVLSGRTDCGLSCFTASGSFWTNQSKALLSLPAEADPRLNPRNRCIQTGYQSVGLFPVRSGQEIIGVLQLNDRNEGRFTADSVSFYESVAQNIGIAIQRAEAETALQHAQDQLRQHAENLEKTVEERTAKLQELVGDLEHFSYTLSHDMRAPLRAMRSFADVMTEECAACPHEDRKGYLHRISASAERMDGLITDALSFTKAVRQELPLEAVDAAALLRGMLDSYPELQPDKANIRIHGDIPVVMGNEAGLTQCFSNLLGNAVKFVAPGKKPEIRIWAQTRRWERVADKRLNPLGWVRIWIEDNGIGIPSNALGRVFDMFTRTHKQYPGSGIGLALVRKVVQRMGGKVGVESEVGQGSRFWLELRSFDNSPTRSR